MRAPVVFVVCCLVVGLRPAAPQPIAGDPTEARLEAAKARPPHVELVASRRDQPTRDPRDQRTPAAVVPAVVVAMRSPARTALPVVQLVSPCAAVAVVDARSSRGPPVVDRSLA